MTGEQDDVQRLRRGYEAFNAGGVAALLDWMAPNVEISDRSTLPDSENYRGVMGIADFFASHMEAFERLEFEPQRFLDAGGDIIAEVRQRAIGRASGVKVEEVVAHRWTIRDGRPQRLRIFGTVEKALAAGKAGST